MYSGGSSRQGPRVSMRLRPRPLRDVTLAHRDPGSPTFGRRGYARRGLAPCAGLGPLELRPARGRAAVHRLPAVLGRRCRVDLHPGNPGRSPWRPGHCERRAWTPFVLVVPSSPTGPLGPNRQRHAHPELGGGARQRASGHQVNPCPGRAAVGTAEGSAVSAASSHRQPARPDGLVRNAAPAHRSAGPTTTDEGSRPGSAPDARWPGSAPAPPRSGPAPTGASDATQRSALRRPVRPRRAIQQPRRSLRPVAGQPLVGGRPRDPHLRGNMRGRTAGQHPRDEQVTRPRTESGLGVEHEDIRNG